MKKNILMVGLLFLMGCTYGCIYEGSDPSHYLKDPKAIIQDPHFTEYQEKRDKLESDYLNKKITYAEYVEEMDELDKTYSEEVEERESVIMNGEMTQ